MIDRPHSPAAERNRQPILDALRGVLPDAASVLEIGAGTGQHADFFTREMPGWQWKPTTVPTEIDTLIAGLDGIERSNLAAPAPLDVCAAGHWPDARFDAVYAANVAHIAPEPAVEALLDGAARVLRPDGRLILYGPFKRDGRHTAESNARFDAELRSRSAGSAIRDVDDLDRWAGSAGLRRIAERAMPANNFVLVFEYPADPPTTRRP